MTADRPSDDDLCLRFGGPFPWHVSYRGVPAVVIPIEDYLKLCAASGRAPAFVPVQGRDRRPALRLSKLNQDPEVLAFVHERLGKVEQKTIIAEIAERFGVQRAPSTTALSRVARRWKRER